LEAGVLQVTRAKVTGALSASSALAAVAQLSSAAAQCCAARVGRASGWRGRARQ
jgi:hypothetical protein